MERFVDNIHTVIQMEGILCLCLMIRCFIASYEYLDDQTSGVQNWLARHGHLLCLIACTHIPMVGLMGALMSLVDNLNGFMEAEAFTLSSGALWLQVLVWSFIEYGLYKIQKAQSRDPGTPAVLNTAGLFSIRILHG